MMYDITVEVQVRDRFKRKPADFGRRNSFQRIIEGCIEENRMVYVAQLQGECSG